MVFEEEQYPVCEDEVTESICVELENVPAGGTGCDFTVTLTFSEITSELTLASTGAP